MKRVTINGMTDKEQAFLDAYQNEVVRLINSHGPPDKYAIKQEANRIATLASPEVGADWEQYKDDWRESRIKKGDTKKYDRARLISLGVAHVWKQANKELKKEEPMETKPPVKVGRPKRTEGLGNLYHYLAENCDYLPSDKIFWTIWKWPETDLRTGRLSSLRAELTKQGYTFERMSMAGGWRIVNRPPDPPTLSEKLSNLVQTLDEENAKALVDLLEGVVNGNGRK